ncbi:hypothetical protein VNO80_13396 [Phaseolus coccineus]|uniref:Uncharacterized protein n=1 Tax=Phaseolus coccineus TaxID=3886 RepID=A0AAN9R9Y3_PHACN
MVPRNPHSTFSHNPCLEPHTLATLQNPSIKNPSNFNLQNPKQWPNALTTTHLENPHPAYTAMPCSPNATFPHNPYLKPHTTVPLQHPSLIRNTSNPNSQNPHQKPNECERPPKRGNTLTHSP